MINDIKKVLVTASEIQVICKELGDKITRDYFDQDLVVIGLLKGCNPFMADLIREIRIPSLEVDYMSVSSYHGTMSSSGDVHIKMDLSDSIKDKHILIAEDIIDTGRTIQTVKQLLLHRGAKSVKVVTLLDKPEGREVDAVADYVGTTIPNEFVVGYGLDYDEKYRNLPYVGVLKPEVYKNRGDL